MNEYLNYWMNRLSKERRELFERLSKQYKLDTQKQLVLLDGFKYQMPENCLDFLASFVRLGDMKMWFLKYTHEYGPGESMP